MTEQDAFRKRPLKAGRRREVEIAAALYDFAKMTGCHPAVATEAAIRLRRKGMTDFSNPATVRRFRELIEAVTNERNGAKIEHKTA